LATRENSQFKKGEKSNKIIFLDRKLSANATKNETENNFRRPKQIDTLAFNCRNAA
jgi:hypothetical protein